MDRITLLISVLLTAVLSFPVCSLRQYHFVNRSMKWEDAQKYCRDNYTDLTTINNMKDLQEILNSVNIETEFVWIGLHKESKSNSETWKWSLGDPAFFSSTDLQYQNWNPNPPGCNGNNDCVFMNKDGKWNCKECNQKQFFICYNDSSKGFILEGTNQNNKGTWREAQIYCRVNHTDLATVKNNEENQKILNLINNQTGDKEAWIGLFRDSWEWSDKSTSSYRNWGTDNPNKQCTNEHCTKVKVKTQNGPWTNEDCDVSLPFVCYEDRMFLIRENRTWPEALNHCRMNQMDLVSVKTEKIQLDVMNVIKNASTSEVWMGLRHSCGLGIWFWVSGEMMCYQNWAPGNGTGPQDCSNGRVGAVQSGGHHQWISLPETRKLNFICTK